MKSRLQFQALRRDCAHALRVLRECQGALDATGSYSPVRLAACIRRLERTTGKKSRPHVAAAQSGGIYVL